MTDEWDLSLLDGITVEPEAAPIPDGIYSATLVGIQPKEDGRYTPLYLAWHFRLEDSRGQVGQSSIKTSRTSKLYKWAIALGFEPPAGMQLRELITLLRGRRCKIRTQIGKRGYSDVMEVLPSNPLGS